MQRIQCIAESICLTLAFATHTKKSKSFDGKRGGSHEMLISDVCQNYQFNTYNTIGSCIFVKTHSYVSKVFSMQTT